MRDSLTGLMRSGRPIVRARPFNRLVAGLGTDAPLDPYALMCDLARCSVGMAALLAAESGPSLRVHECIQAALKRFDEEFLSLFDRESPRKIARLALIARYVGGPLGLAVARSLVASVTGSAVTADEARAVILLVERRIVDDAMHGRYDHRAPAKLRKAWPASLARDLDDLVLVTHLAAAPYCRPCAPPQQQIVRAILPGLRAAKGLVAPDPDTQSGEPRRWRGYRHVATAPGAWCASLAPTGNQRSEVEATLRRFVDETRLPISAFLQQPEGTDATVTLIRDLHRQGNGLNVLDSELVLARLIRATRWRRARTEAATAFLIAFELAGDSAWPPHEILARLLSMGRAKGNEWRTAPARLVSVRPVGATPGWVESPGLVVSSSVPDLLGAALLVASELLQRKLTVIDFHADRTVRFALEDEPRANN